LHPENRKYVDGTDGIVRCNGLMKWYATKVLPLKSKFKSREPRLGTDLFIDIGSLSTTETKNSKALPLCVTQINYSSTKETDRPNSEIVQVAVELNLD
jgi:hypothetical protein